MRRRVTWRTRSATAAAALTALLLSAVAAYADTVPADGDAVAAGNQTLVDLGEAAPGQTITRPVAFALTCAGLSHPAPGATITLALDSSSVPLDGAADATTTTIGPVPAEWTPTGEGCPSPAPTLAAANPSTVTLTMPTTPGTDYDFTLAWSRSGATGLTGMTTITFRVDVVANAPPSLHLPGDLTAEATSPSGAAVSWSASATDAEDANPPTPICTPASGSTFALGTTTVDCTVTDGGGLTDIGSFTVTVTYVEPVDWSVVWGEPVVPGGSGGSASSSGAGFVAQAGRTVPVKLEIFADGVEQTSGAASLEIRACAGASATVEVALVWDGQRWAARLDTSRLAGPGCHDVAAVFDTHVAGSFQLDLREPAMTAAPKR